MNKLIRNTIRRSMWSSTHLLCRTIALAAIIVMATMSVSAQSFRYGDFSSTAGLALSRDAAVVANTIRLTRQPRNPGDVGSGLLWSRTQIDVTQPFTTRFQFRTSNPSPGGGADGIGFVFQNSTGGTAAQNAGFFGLARSVVVEFDMFNNPGGANNDADGNHISVHTGAGSPGGAYGTDENVSSIGATGRNGVATLGPNMKDGNVHDVTIAYTPATGAMRIWMDRCMSDAPQLTVTVSLQGKMGGPLAYIGFCGITGSAMQNQDIVGWSFDTCLQAAPTITPTGATTFCQGGSVALTSSVSNYPFADGTLYHWSNGATTQSITVATSGSYWVETTGGACCTTRSAMIDVVANPLPSLDLGADVEICRGGSTMIGAIATGGTGAQIYQWSPVTGLADSGSPITMASPNATTLYILTITDDAGCSVADSVLVTVNPMPVIDIGADLAVCDGGSIMIDAKVTGGAGTFAYRWTPATGLSNPTALKPIASPRTTTRYTLTVTDSKGCSATDSVMVTIRPAPIANAGADVTTCAGIPVVLHASGGTTYRWTPTTGLSDPTSADPIANPSATTTYSVVVSNNGSCPDTDIVTVTVLPKVTANAGPDVAICIGERTQLSASGGTGYRWYPTTGLSDPTIPNPIAQPNATTTYSVIVTNSEGCLDTATVRVTVEEPQLMVGLPQLTADPRTRGLRIPISFGTTGRGCRPDSITLVISFNANLFVPRSASRGTITRNTIEQGIQIVEITIGGVGQLQGNILTELIGDVLLGDTIYTPLRIDAVRSSSGARPATITNGGLTLTGLCTSGGVRLLKNSSRFTIAKITPNPSRGATTVIVRTSEPIPTQLELYSATGERLFTTEWTPTPESGTESEKAIALPSTLPSGIYRITLRSATSVTSEGLMIVK